MSNNAKKAGLNCVLLVTIIGFLLTTLLNTNLNLENGGDQRLRTEILPLHDERPKYPSIVVRLFLL